MRFRPILTLGAALFALVADVSAVDKMSAKAKGKQPARGGSPGGGGHAVGNIPLEGCSPLQKKHINDALRDVDTLATFAGHHFNMQSTA
jgi:hypothetical protein